MKLNIQFFGGRGAKSSQKSDTRTKEEKFNDFRFDGLKWNRISNNYISMDRVSKDGSRVVVKVDDDNLVKTPFGYALIIDKHNVVFLKDWAVSQNNYGSEVMLNKTYFKVKQWGNHENFPEKAEKGDYTFDGWKKIASEQQKIPLNGKVEIVQKRNT